MLCLNVQDYTPGFIAWMRLVHAALVNVGYHGKKKKLSYISLANLDFAKLIALLIILGGRA